MKRRLDHLENINDNEPQNKRQKISNNDSNQHTNANNNCKYWKLKNSYTENGYWSIFKLYVSTDLDRIGVVLFRKTNKTFKIIVIETDNEIWRLEGKIASPYLISFDDKLNICIKAYQSLNDKKIIVYNITNIQSKPKTISIKNGKFSDPNISLVKILNNKIENGNIQQAETNLRKATQFGWKINLMIDKGIMNKNDLTNFKKLYSKMMKTKVIKIMMDEM
eukprot:273226_1